MASGTDEFEDIARRHFETFSDSSRQQLRTLTLQASYEAGIENDYRFSTSDSENPGLDPPGEDTFVSEFQITEDGPRTRGLVEDKLPTLAIQHAFSGQLELM